MDSVSMTACEGRCGSRLDPEGRELPGPPWTVGEDDYTPAHTPERCRLIRLYRDTITEAVPGWEVLVYPLWPGRLMTKVRREVDGQLVTSTRAVPENAPFKGGIAMLAEYEAKHYAREVAEFSPS